MFEIMELGKPGWFSRHAKLIATCDMEGTKLFSDIPTHHIEKKAQFKAGEAISIRISKKSLLKVGDRLGLNTLLAKSYLDEHLTYTRRVSSTG